MSSSPSATWVGAGVAAHSPGTLGIATGVGEDFALGGLDATNDRVEQLTQVGDLAVPAAASLAGVMLSSWENGVADAECVGNGKRVAGRPGDKAFIRVIPVCIVELPILNHTGF